MNVMKAYIHVQPMPHVTIQLGIIPVIVMLDFLEMDSCAVVQLQIRAYV